VTVAIEVSANDGTTWTPSGGQTRMPNGTLTLAVVSPRRVLVGGAVRGTGGLVQVTADGGATWTVAGGVPQPGFSWLAAAGGDTVDGLAAGAGGLYLSTDGGAGFSDLQVR